VSRSKRRSFRFPQLAALLAAGFIPAQTAYCVGHTTVRVLLVGNSIGSYWSSTSWMGEIARSLGATPLPKVEASVTGRVESLQAHLSDTYGLMGLTAIRKGGWNIVVLQENPYEPLLRQDGFFSSVTRLAGEARKGGAEVILFEPYALAPGSVVFGEPWSGGSAQKMQDLLRRACDQIAVTLHMRQARVGDAFEWVSAHNPEIDLYENDKIHPSPCGAFLQACVLVSLLTGRDVRESRWLPKNGVVEAQARVLRAAASMSALRK
jgi:hypothetical protein